LLCVEFFPAEKCKRNPEEVVNTFLGILLQHKR
jgi:hypothetical protein